MTTMLNSAVAGAIKVARSAVSAASAANGAVVRLNVATVVRGHRMTIGVANGTAAKSAAQIKANKIGAAGAMPAKAGGIMIATVMAISTGAGMAIAMASLTAAGIGTMTTGSIVAGIEMMMSG
jgi:hypothetical protein